MHALYTQKLCISPTQESLISSNMNQNTNRNIEGLAIQWQLQSKQEVERCRALSTLFVASTICDGILLKGT